MAKEFKITSLRLADLEKELNYLKTTREREVAAMIAEARSYGDLSENSEYDAAKNEQGKLYGRIAEIEDILSHAVIIEDENEATGRVGLGCTVVVEDEKGKQTTSPHPSTKPAAMKPVADASPAVSMPPPSSSHPTTPTKNSTTANN